MITVEEILCFRKKLVTKIFFQLMITVIVCMEGDKWRKTQDLANEVLFNFMGLN